MRLLPTLGIEEYAGFIVVTPQAKRTIPVIEAAPTLHVQRQGRFVSFSRTPDFFAKHANRTSMANGKGWVWNDDRKVTMSNISADCRTCLDHATSMLIKGGEPRTVLWVSCRLAITRPALFEIRDDPKRPGKTIKVEQGAYIVTNSHQDVKFLALGQAPPVHEHLAVSIQLQLFHDVLTGLGCSPAFREHVKFDNAPQPIGKWLGSAVELLSHALDTHYRAGSDHAVESALTHVVLTLLHEHPHNLEHDLLTEWGPKVHDERIAQAVRYFHDHFAKSIALTDLVSIIHMSRAAFFKRFEQETGTTPRQMLLSIRLEHARKLLRTTSKTMDAIAQETGFSSASYFVTAFRQAAGITPAHFRSAMESVR